ncbi:BglG family transcription antiterminator [Streptococcus iniae]|uniref:BglG family transcription antiterminator n=1 Tax=Streptococcus iniae TaxID=1346 RepID=UPI0027402B61|nr:HTH domain-containing protein [Streptococcus iniae]WLR88615.1 HTH domain-containing protein [Streptococcus iniae]WLR89073.1 HTH domain-containing protein [Streptococcus iniae]
MLLTKREEQLMKAFLSYGKLSIDNMEEILKVSRRTVYRVLNDLTISLNSQNISIIKEDQKYFFTGQLDVLQSFSSQESFSKVERLNLMTYYLLTSQSELTNDFFQEEFAVSNVTIIQDIAEIETRLSDFDVQIKRQKGYSISDKTFKKRWLLAILLSNNISLSDFWQMKMGYFDFISADRLVIAKSVFQKHQSELPEMDSKLLQFFIILLALSNWQAIEKDNQSVSKLALDFSQKVFADFSSQSNDFYPISEILYFAKLLDLLLLKRQETPLFQENFDSEFFYNVSNLIDKVALYTKINFTKDQTLFKFLFNHIRLSLAVQILFADSKVTDLAHEALRNNEYLHRVIQLLVMEIFPNYLQTEWELELITLHFASSLRRSPQIYPVRILLLTDERPLATELLVSRLKNIAPFIESIATKACSSLEESDFDTYDAILATKLLSHDNIQFVSTYPNPSEMLGLEEFLQDVQINRDVKLRESQNVMMQMDFKDYFNASQLILKRFYLKPLNNRKQFNHTIDDIIQNVDMVSDKEYLTRKLNKRFNESPMAIPETNLALIHTQSSKVMKSVFLVFELENPVFAKSMNGQDELVKRVLVMLTPLEEGDEVRDLMTAISQSIIENHLYTEIYKKANQDIIYQLLNQIFTEKIKKLEN